MKHPLSVIFLLVSLVLPAMPASAAGEIVEKTFCTQGIAYESMDALKLDLLNNAKKAVINELFGEFIVASTAVENYVVTKDQIQTSSIGFVRVEGNTDFHNGDDFADVCVTIQAYVTVEDRAKFDPEKIVKKYCDADDNLTTAQLIAYVKDEVIIQALVEYDPTLKNADRDSLLQLVQRVTYRENGFITDTQTYCTTFEGYVVPVEVMAFLESGKLSVDAGKGKLPIDSELDLTDEMTQLSENAKAVIGVNYYGNIKDGWHSEQPRMMADVNGDGKDDVVGFGNEGVYVSLSTGSQFLPPKVWVDYYGYDVGNWRVSEHPRMTADVNGDGKKDIVGFGNEGVYVSLSTSAEFTEPELWVGNYGQEAGGWRVGLHPRMMADVNGDGKADIVGFGDAGVYVSLSIGSEFTEPELWVGNYGLQAGGWNVDMHPRVMADVNGDGKADVVGFADAGVYVSLSAANAFTEPEIWIGDYGREAGGWSIDRHPRTLADVNGDGKDDIIGFGNDGVMISLSTGNQFTPAQLIMSSYGYVSDGWRADRHPRVMADINGDGRSDIVGFGDDGVYVSILYEGDTN